MKKALVFLSLLLAATAHAASGGYAFRQYSSREGLASNSVRAIIQDHMGLVWIGSSGGLDSFDGRDIIHHPFPHGEIASVKCLLEDAAHTLWIGTDNTVYRYSGNQISQIPGIREADITGMAEGEDGTLWVTTWGKGVFRIRDGVPEGLLDGHMLEDVLVAADGRIWVADSSEEPGLLVYNAATGTFVSPGLSFEECTPTRICAIEQDGNGDLWLGTWNLGLYRMDAGTRTVRPAAAPEAGFNHIHSLTHDGTWKFLVGSDDGLLELNFLTGERTLYRNDRKDRTSLSDKFVYPVMRDREGGLWIGTYYGGVNYASPDAGRFLFRSLSDLVGADEDYIVSCLCEDPDGTLWFGSDNGGLFHYDPVRNTAGRWPAAPGWSRRLASLNVHALLRWEDDLWIGTYSENLIRINLRTGRIREYGPSDGLNASSVYALQPGADGTLWAGTSTGICRFDADADRFIPERTADWVMGILAGADGTLWFTTVRNGVLCRAADGSWRSFTVDDGLLSNYVNCLDSAPDGIYVGTQNGLSLLQEDGATTLLPDENIQKIVFDGKQLWISTVSGLLRYSPENGRHEPFGESEGLQTSLFSQNAGLLARDGSVYLGAADGFISFFPGAIKTNTLPPPVIFTRFQASGPGISENVFQSQGFNRIVLPWRMRDLRISFAALSYSAPEKVQYAYRLEGLSPDWKELGNQNYLSLNQLQPGHYHLQVIAWNAGGTWDQEGASLSFIVRPHPLVSNIAITLYVLFTAALFYLLGRWYLRRTARKSELQFARKLDEALSLAKEEERDDRYQLITALSDQLEAPLAGIETQLDRLNNRPQALAEAKGEINLIEKNHRMLKGVAASLQQLRGNLSPRHGESRHEPTREEDFLTRLDRLINDNISNPDLSVPFLAKELAISRSGLFAKVKELTGETPNSLINQARLNAAAKLLSEGKHTVGEICYMTGFSSPSYFSKSFVSQFGFTPHEWMQMHRG
ncbi:MAG: helix-turn-helix domain-containing protein [Bacteroidales bacterium]|nr:helix-turn-helix domain-containing protein [Bacteroidales bacterium]